MASHARDGLVQLGWEAGVGRWAARMSGALAALGSQSEDKGRGLNLSEILG